MPMSSHERTSALLKGAQAAFIAGALLLFAAGALGLYAYLTRVPHVAPAALVERLIV